MKKFIELTEAKETVVFGFGRFNPPTTGHEKLIEKVASVAGSNPFFIYPSHTTGPKDPLAHAKKVAWMRKMFPKYKKNIIADRNAKTAIMIAEKLYNDGYKNLIMVAGSDRVKEFDTILQKYNDAPDKKGNQLFKFDSVKVVSAGERDPDAEGVSGMSASKMRAAASDGKFDDFKTGIPSTLNDADKKKLYFEVRKAMGVREEREMGDDYDSLRDAYLTGKIWNVGDTVEANGVRGEVVRKGTNYLSFVAEDGKVHKAWLHEIELDEEKVPNDDLNWVETGGSFGKKRRFPTYVVKKEGNKYKAYDEQNKMSLKAGANSLEDLAKMLKPYIEKRTGSWKFEEVDLDESKMSSSQIDKLKKAYEPMRGKRISTSNAEKLGKMMDTIGKDKEALIQIVKADIPFVSTVAVNRLISKHNMKGAEINKLKEEVDLDERNYAKEYANYQGTPEQIARRSSRNKARRAMGDKAVKGMDVGHKDNDPLNNSPDNLRNEDPSDNRREPRLREKHDAGYPDDSVKIGKKHYIIYKDRRDWYGYEVDKDGNQLGDSVFDPSKKELVKILARESIDEVWWDDISTKISQISHPAAWGKVVKQYVDGMKDPEHRKHPSKWAADVAQRYRGIEPRDLVKYINKLVDKGELPKELKAEVQRESFKSFVDQIQVQEVLGSGASQKDYIDDFIVSNAPQFKGKSKKERIGMAIAAFRSKN